MERRLLHESEAVVGGQIFDGLFLGKGERRKSRVPAHNRASEEASRERASIRARAEAPPSLSFSASESVGTCGEGAAMLLAEI
jgi:hypothetical protein